MKRIFIPSSLTLPEPFFARPSSRVAFTLIEMMVVLAISALFSTLAITYSSVSRNVVTLSVETSKISQFILQAKQLSIATYSGDSGSCGYGFTLDPANQTYSIFDYVPTGAPPCPTVASITSISSAEEKQYTQGTWQVKISPGVKLEPTNAHGDSLMTVLFYPPNPTVFLSGDGSSFPSPAATLNVYLETVDGKNTAAIAVNPEGQVDF